MTSYELNSHHIEFMILYRTLGKASVTCLLVLFAVVKALETSTFNCALKLLKCAVPPDWVAYTATPNNKWLLVFGFYLEQKGGGDKNIHIVFRLSSYYWAVLPKNCGLLFSHF